MTFGKIWNDRSLYGDRLTRFPGKLWHFTCSSKLYSYTKPDPGTAQRYLLIFEKYLITKRDSNGNYAGAQMGTNSLLFKYSEMGLRKVIGASLTAGALLTAAPLGFAIKIVHKKTLYGQRTLTT